MLNSATDTQPSNAASKIHMWESTRTIWNLGLASACNARGLNPDPVQALDQETFDPAYYQNLNPGDTVWLRCRHLRDFQDAVPAMVPITLLVLDGDETFPSESGVDDVERMLESPLIKAVFAQNCTYSGPSAKVHPVPIGIDFHTIAYRGGGWGDPQASPIEQEAQLLNFGACPWQERLSRIFVDFQVSDTTRGGLNRYLQTGEDRASIFRTITSTGLVDHAPRMRRSELWATKSRYLFSVSPHGNGLDCHRTWEDLALGLIPIVKSSPLDSLYDGLPVVIVNDWTEISDRNLRVWAARFRNTSRERIRMSYWLQKIKSVFK